MLLQTHMARLAEADCLIADLTRLRKDGLHEFLSVLQGCMLRQHYAAVSRDDASTSMRR